MISCGRRVSCRSSTISGSLHPFSMVLPAVVIACCWILSVTTAAAAIDRTGISKYEELVITTVSSSSPANNAVSTNSLVSTIAAAADAMGSVDAIVVPSSAPLSTKSEAIINATGGLDAFVDATAHQHQHLQKAPEILKPQYPVLGAAGTTEVQGGIQGVGLRNDESDDDDEITRHLSSSIRRGQSSFIHQQTALSDPAFRRRRRRQSSSARIGVDLCLPVCSKCTTTQSTTVQQTESNNAAPSGDDQQKAAGRRRAVSAAGNSRQADASLDEIDLTLDGLMKDQVLLSELDKLKVYMRALMDEQQQEGGDNDMDAMIDSASVRSSFERRSNLLEPAAANRRMRIHHQQDPAMVRGRQPAGVATHLKRREVKSQRHFLQPGGLYEDRRERDAQKRFSSALDGLLGDLKAGRLQLYPKLHRNRAWLDNHAGWHDDRGDGHVHYDSVMDR